MGNPAWQEVNKMTQNQLGTLSSLVSGTGTGKRPLFSMQGDCTSSQLHSILLYVDQNGKLKVKASPSMIGYMKDIVQPDVMQRFVKAVSMASQQGFLRKRRNDPDNASRESGYGSLVFGGSTSTKPPIQQIALKVGNKLLLQKYYQNGFDAFQQVNCKLIAKAFVKTVEPQKHINHPYNGRTKLLHHLDPELTKPKWWPAGSSTNSQIAFAKLVSKSLYGVSAHMEIIN